MRTRQGFSWFAKKRTQPAQPGSSAFPPKECMLAMDLFCDLEPAALAAFERQTEMRTCRKGQILYSQEDRAEVLFLLKRGRVQLYRLTPSGKRLELATLEPGTFFGEMPLVGETLRLSQERSGEAVPITHQELGDMIGALRESVTKVLDEFQRAGLVELSRGRIILRDVVGLQSRLEE